MEYHLRHPQPFTLAEATRLDVSIITEEIARLQNSLQHLRETQAELRLFVQGEAANSDPVLVEAFRDNEGVIGSQEERISMLNMALIEKGIIGSSGHYELAETPSSIPTTAPPGPAGQAQALSQTAHPLPDDLMDEDGGVTL